MHEYNHEYYKRVWSTVIKNTFFADIYFSGVKTAKETSAEEVDY